MRGVRGWGGVANLVLQDTVERIFVQDLYADVQRGIFLVRGENVLLLGEIVRALLTVTVCCPFLISKEGSG